MIEFVIVLPVLLMLIFGALQFAFIYHAKTTLNHAAFLAAREGAVNNAHLGLMELAMARGMAPLYAHCDTVAEVKRARNHVQAEIQNGFGRIEIINPPVAAFDDFSLTNNDGQREIPNDNLMYRNSSSGSLSGLNIQDANVLKIRASYCYPMYVPFIKTLITSLMTQPASADCPTCLNTFPAANVSFENGCFANDRFPINAQAIVRMHSSANDVYMTDGMYPGPAPAGTLVDDLGAVCP